MTQQMTATQFHEQHYNSLAHYYIKERGWNGAKDMMNFLANEYKKDALFYKERAKYYTKKGITNHAYRFCIKRQDENMHKFMAITNVIKKLFN